MSITFKAFLRGEEKDFVLNIPTGKDIQDSQKVFNRVMKEALNDGAILREKLDDVMRSQGLWDDEKDQKVATLQSELRDLDYRLRKGGIKKSQGKAYALRMIELREDISSLLSQKAKLDSLTAQGQAENAKFQQLIVSCLVYTDNSKVFKDIDDYIMNAIEPAAFEAAQRMAQLMVGYTSDDKNLPEYKFLRKFKFVDDNLRLIDDKGRLVDREGRLINEEGRFIDDKGNFVDRDGRPVNEEGEYLIDAEPFLDDDGTPIVEPKQEEKVEEKVEETVEESKKTEDVLVTPES